MDKGAEVDHEVVEVCLNAFETFVLRGSEEPSSHPSERYAGCPVAEMFLAGLSEPAAGSAPRHLLAVGRGGERECADVFLDFPKRSGNNRVRQWWSRAARPRLCSSS